MNYKSLQKLCSSWHEGAKWNILVWISAIFVSFDFAFSHNGLKVQEVKRGVWIINLKNCKKVMFLLIATYFHAEGTITYDGRVADLLCMTYKGIEESLQKSLNVSRSSGALEFGLWERRVRLFFQHDMLKVGKDF